VGRHHGREALLNAAGLHVRDRDRFGRYRKVSKLGSGGMGDVYLCADDELNRFVAVKTFRAGVTPDAAARLQREARAQASLRHENIVIVHELIVEGEEMFLVMEYVAGPTLEELLRSRYESRMEWREAVDVFLKILAALQCVHRHGLVHRDVKPSNVMVAGDVVKLTDFGIAVLADASHLSTLSRDLGTRMYMAPEQFDRHATIDCRADIYSAGLVLYRMLAGHPAYPSKDDLEAARLRLAPPPDLLEMAPEVSRQVVDALALALQYEPRDRFQTAAEFAAELAKAAEGFTPEGPRKTWQEDIKTVRTPQTEPHKSVSIVSFISIAVNLVAMYALWLNAEPPVPPAGVPSAMTKKIVVPQPAKPVEIVAAEPRRPVESSVLPPAAPPKKPAAEAPRPDRHAEEERRVQVAGVKRGVEAALERGRAALRAGELDAAQAELDRASDLAQAYREDLWQQLDEVTAASAEVRQARSAAQTERDRKALAGEMWGRLLAEVEANAGENSLWEAKRGAQRLLADPAAPEEITESARKLLESIERRLQERKAGFSIGPAESKVQDKRRKPPAE
jgi:serine/threonine-protein kinase